MRRCFIHIGTHKTGTTSIQHLLSRNAPALLERGYSYPRAGRLEEHPGHHNLAWEITGDRRFEIDNGTIADLVREVKEGSDDIILSSEDFECSLYNGTRFSDFVSLIQSCGFAVTVVVYVRNQIDYLPRIYFTHLHFELDLPFAAALDSTLDSGLFRWREWTVNFDYCDVLTRIRNIENVNVVVRSYEPAQGSICNDFLSIFNLSLRDLQVEEEPFENRSLYLRDYLKMFLRHRMRRQLSEREEVVVNSLVPAEAKTIRLSPAVRAELLQRFSDTNRRLFSQYGIAEPRFSDYGQPEPIDSVYVDELFLDDIEKRLG